MTTPATRRQRRTPLTRAARRALRPAPAPLTRKEFREPTPAERAALARVLEAQRQEQAAIERAAEAIREERTAQKRAVAAERKEHAARMRAVAAERTAQAALARAAEAAEQERAAEPTSPEPRPVALVGAAPATITPVVDEALVEERPVAPTGRSSVRGRVRTRASAAKDKAHSAILKLGSSYFPGVDGMRAIAILSVLVYHTGIYHNGLFGVDVFFVLSGYLITLTLLREFHRSGTVKLGSFYLRRVKRLLPLLIVMLLGTLAAVVAFGNSHELQRFGEQALASLFYVTNWEQIGAGQAYWDGFDALNPLGHMWSLAITEQFYLVWPILLLGVLLLGKALAKRSKKPHGWQWSRITAILVLAVGTMGLIAAAVLPNLVYDGTNPDRVYLGTDTHFAGLVAGAAAAAVSYLLMQKRARTAAQRGYVVPVMSRSKRTFKTIAMTATSVALLAAIVFASYNASSYEEAWLYEFGFVAVAIAASALVLTLTSPENLLTKVFAWKPLVELGKVSYTLFLIHMPIYWIISSTGDWGPVDLLILGVPTSILVACGLHHLVAEPIRLRDWRKKGGTVFLSTLALTAAAAIVVPALVKDMNAGPQGTGQVTVLTLGDSLANDFASALSVNAGDQFTVIDAGIPGCGIAGSSGQTAANGITQGAPQNCNPWEERWQAAIDEHNPDAIVVNIAWDAVTQLFGEKSTDVLDPEFAEKYRERLVTMADILTASGASVHIANSRLYNAVVTTEQAIAYNAILADVLAGYPTLNLLDLQAQVCTTEDCTTQTADGERMYLDNRVHFSDAGKRQIAPWLTDQILTGVRSTTRSTS